MRETCLEKHLWNKLCIKYAGATFKIPFCMGWQSYKENPECGPPGSFTSRHSLHLTVKAEWSCSLYASFLLFHQLCGDKRVKMFFSLPEISDSGKSLIILENQEGGKKQSIRSIFCTFLFLWAIAQAKEFINATFVLKWRPLETFKFPRQEKWRKDGGVLQYNRKRSTMLVDRLKELNFKGFFYNLLMYCSFVPENYNELIFQFIFTQLISQPNKILESAFML